MKICALIETVFTPTDMYKVSSKKKLFIEHCIGFLCLHQQGKSKSPVALTKSELLFVIHKNNDALTNMN